MQEFCAEPRLFRNGTDRFDINQGQAGTCWFLAVLASLAEYTHIIEQVGRVSFTPLSLSLSLSLFCVVKIKTS